MYTASLRESDIRAAFPPTHSGGMVNGNHYEFGSKWIDRPITIKLMKESSGISRRFVSIVPPFESVQIREEFGNRLVSTIINPFEGKIFNRLAADRDVKPEMDQSPVLDMNGNGATNIIQYFFNKAYRIKDGAKRSILAELNKIFSPDAKFSDINVLQNEDNRWEIFLDEDSKGRISLSHSGSGLKTIILVLVNILLIPRLAGRDLHDFLFAFEELENNLHPALQRRLLAYLQEVASKEHCVFFLTTHSNVIIDLFNRNDSAQIIHVVHNGEFATCKRVKTYIENKGILDDLDVRASDLLQANCIVWVEGPSDRLYFNKWISLWTDGKLKEGAHYQCVFYGGRLLAHLSAKEDKPDEASGVEILKVNKNAIILIDSDKKFADAEINATKKRIISEIESVGGFSWVTNGKEIENYISTAALKAFFQKDDLPNLEPYADIKDYLNAIGAGIGDKYKDNKVLFAEHICQLLTKEMLGDVVSLKEKIAEASDRIKSWNRL